MWRSKVFNYRKETHKSKLTHSKQIEEEIQTRIEIFKKRTIETQYNQKLIQKINIISKPSLIRKNISIKEGTSLLTTDLKRIRGSILNALMRMNWLLYNILLQR